MDYYFLNKKYLFVFEKKNILNEKTYIIDY